MSEPRRQPGVPRPERRAGAMWMPLLALLLAACATPLPDRYYVVDLAAVPVPVVDDRFDRAVTVLLDDLPAEVDRPELALREGSNGVDVLEADRWAAPLADNLRRQLVLGLGRSLPAAWVGTSDFGAAPLRVRVRIEALTLDRAGHAALVASWVSRDGEAPPRQGRVALSRDVPAASLSAGVAAWSAELAELATSVARALAR